MESGIPTVIREGRKDSWPLSATIPYDTTILLQFATPFNDAACGAWSAIAIVSADSRRTPPAKSPNRVPVDTCYGETINLDFLLIRRPNNCDLQAVCGALEEKLLPQNYPANENEY